MRLIRKISFLLSLLSSLSLSAQEMYGGGYLRHEIGFHVGIEVPTGNLSHVYNSGPSLGGQYSYIRAITDHTAWGTDVRLGYSNFEPKQDTFYFLTGETSYGTAHYSDYQMARLMVGLRLLHMYDKTEFYYGLDAGYYYANYTLEGESPDLTLTPTGTVEGMVALGLKLGINFLASEHVGIGIENQFHVFDRGDSEGNIQLSTDEDQIIEQMYSLRLTIYYRIVVIK